MSKRQAVLKQLAGVRSNSIRRDVAHVVEADIYVDAVTLKDTLKVLWADSLGWHVENVCLTGYDYSGWRYYENAVNCLVISSDGITSRLRGLEATQNAVKFSFSPTTQ